VLMYSIYTDEKMYAEFWRGNLNEEMDKMLLIRINKQDGKAWTGFPRLGQVGTGVNKVMYLRVARFEVLTEVFAKIFHSSGT